MEVDWTCALNAIDIPGLPLDGHLMAVGDVKKNSGKRDEGTGMDLGILGGCCRLQQTDVKRIKY